MAEPPDSPAPALAHTPAQAAQSVLAWMGWLLLGLALGALATAGVWRSAKQLAPVAAPWQHAAALADAADTPWARARRAVVGSLAPDAAQVWALHAHTDDAGALLSSRCTYAIEGPPPPAQGWSLHAYSVDGDWLGTTLAAGQAMADGVVLPPGQWPAQLPGAPPGTPWRIQTQPDGALADADLQRDPAAAQTPQRWLLPTPVSDGLVLVLRLYQPNESVLARTNPLQAWRIQRLGACE